MRCYFYNSSAKQKKLEIFISLIYVRVEYVFVHLTRQSQQSFSLGGVVELKQTCYGLVVICADRAIIFLGVDIDFALIN